MFVNIIDTLNIYLSNNIKFVFIPYILILLIRNILIEVIFLTNNSYLKNLIEILKKNFFTLFLFIFILIKSVVFNFQVYHEFSKRVFLINLSLIALTFFIVQLIFKKKKNMIFIILNILASIIFVSNSVFYREYNDFITLIMVKQIGQASEVSSSIWVLLKWSDLLYAIDFPFIVLLLIKFRNRPSSNLKKFHSSIGICISVIGLCLGLFWANHESPGIITIQFSRFEQVKQIGIFSMYDIQFAKYVDSKVNYKPITSSEEKQIKEDFRTELSSASGKYKGKNLIVIQVESLQGFLVNQTYNGKEITPNLNKLLKESAYFDNCYVQVGVGHTADAELLVNTSLYPDENTSAYIDKPTNTYSSIGNSLKSIGYSTMAFHGNKKTFWNRNLVYPSLGFDKFYSLETFKQDDVQWGLSDMSMFRQSFDIIKNAKQPFYSFLVTITSHSPFDVAANHFTDGKNYMEKYINAINYTDKAIGTFVDNLRASGMLDNSILVVYGDHQGIDNDSIGNLFNTKLDTSYKQQNYNKIPMIIRLPDGANAGINHKSIGQGDMLATIRDLYGINDNKAFGHDVFSPGDNFVVLSQGSYVYGDNYYDDRAGKTYNLKTGEVVPNDTALIKSAKQKLSSSNLIFEYDYLKKLLNSL